MGFFKKNIGKIAGGYFGGALGFLAGSQHDSNRAAALERAGFDPYSGMPVHPDYIGMEPEAFGKMYDNVNFSRAPLQQYTNEAMRTGPSRNALLAMEANDADTLLNVEKARKMGANLSSQARSSLASRGGLTSGAAERIAKTGRDKTMDLIQAANAQGSGGRINIGMEDERNRVDMLGRAPAMQQSAGQFDLTKADQKAKGMVGLHQDKNNFNMDKYKTNMSTWAANKQADATMRGGGGGGGKLG